jgi:hypothetical protein
LLLRAATATIQSKVVRLETVALVWAVLAAKVAEPLREQVAVSREEVPERMVSLVAATAKPAAVASQSCMALGVQVTAAKAAREVAKAKRTL